MKTVISGYPRIRLTIVMLTALILSACGGAISYEHNDAVFAGPLDDNNLSVMKSTGKLQSLGSFDDMQHGIDKSGTFVGICRTRFAKANGDNTPTDGETEFEVHSIARQKRFSISQSSLAKKIDSFASTSYADIIKTSPFIYLHCYQIGASNDGSRLVLYFQLQGTEDLAQNTAVEVNVSGTSLTVLDFELFDRSSAPTSVIALDNPLKGNTIAIQNGEIHINGSAVVVNGNTVEADNVKYQFK